MLRLKKTVGFDQKILLHQLDYVAKQSKKQSKKDMYDILDGYLRQDITGAKSRKNAITMLMKIWYNVPEEITKIREEVLDVFNDFSNGEKLFAHWNMTMLAYPFFKDVANEFGRLFQLQDEVSSSTILKRMKDNYGERRRVEVASSAVISSMKAWDIVVSEKNGVYKQSRKVGITNPILQALFIHTLFYVREAESLYIDTMNDSPLYFPFQIDLQIHELRERKDFSFHYQGVEKLIVEKGLIRNE